MFVSERQWGRCLNAFLTALCMSISILKSDNYTKAVMNTWLLSRKVKGQIQDNMSVGNSGCAYTVSHRRIKEVVCSIRDVDGGLAGE